MGKTLIIAEKYLAACDIANALKCMEHKEGYIEGENYIITWADGHLIGFQYPEEYNPEYKEWKLEQLPLEFNPQTALKIYPEKQQQFDIVKRLIQGTETDMIINAGDAGREGYLIQNRIYKMAGNRKPVKVLWASALTEEAILHAMQNLRDDDEFVNILEEAEARAAEDYILGMNYSRLLTLKCSNDITLPYGPCMTPLLNLIVKREKEIAEFVPIKSYVIEIEYEGGIKGEILDNEGKAVAFSQISSAQEIVEEITLGAEGTIEVTKIKETHQKAPFLFDLAELQTVIGGKYKYTPAQTLQIAQSLYEKHKIISYPRTDSRYLPETMSQTVKQNLSCCDFGNFHYALEKARKDELEADEIYFNDEKVKDHHALIPIVNKKMSQIYTRLSEMEKNVFDEIVYSFLGYFCRERVRKSLSAQVYVDGYVFRSTVSAEIEAGFKLLRSTEEEDAAEIAIIDEWKPGKKLTVKDVHILERVSEPPARYTVGTITNLMKKYHIGTPATMAATIEKLLDKDRPFLILNNGKYYTTPFGRMYISVIPEELKNPELRELMEYKLQQIREGNMSKEELLDEVMKELENNLSRDDFRKLSFSRGVKVKKSTKANYKRKRGSHFI